MAYPDWIANQKNTAVRKQWKEWWDKPWTVPLPPDRAKGYKERLRNHGRYSTHFTIDEFKSHADRCGCGAARSPYPARTQKVAFKCERVKHRLNGAAIRNASMYRTPCHENCIGGANGYHPRGQAIDPVQPSGVSTANWNRAWEAEFGGGGIGKQGSSSGSVRHADTGPQRRWYY